jgi:cytochrome P450
MRTLVNRAFTPARVEALAPRIADIAAALAGDLAAAGNGADLVTLFSGVLPLQVICELFGVPEADRPRLRTWTRHVMTAGPQALAAHQAMTSYLIGFADRRRSDPRDDLTSMLIKVQADSDVTLSDEELADLLWLILLAGHETTTHLLSNAVVALSRHPDQRDLAVRDGLWAEVTEETLRRYPSVATVFMRYTTRATVLAGVALPAGAAIVQGLAAALTDPASTARTPTGSTSPAASGPACRSVTGRTSASAPRWAAWRGGSRFPSCTSGSRNCTWPSIRPR